MEPNTIPFPTQERDPPELTTEPREEDEGEGEGSSEEAESPFIPGTNIQWAWDSTSLGYFKTCPRLYQYLIIEGWQNNDESVHLRFGGEFHTSVQQYELSRAAGIGHNDSVHDIVRDLLLRTWGWNPDKTTKAGKYKNRDSLIRAVIDYLDKYEHDEARTYIKPDGAPAVELSFRFELDFEPDHIATRPYTLCGHLDRVVEFNGGLYVMDYKTTTQTVADYFFKQFQPNNQMTLYTLAGGVILDAKIKGVIVNGIQLLIEEPDRTRVVRNFTYRTNDQLDEWLDDLAFWLGYAESCATNNHWPQNDLSCDKYGGCRFREICSKSPDVRERFLKTDFTKGEPWNPLKTR